MANQTGFQFLSAAQSVALKAKKVEDKKARVASQKAIKKASRLSNSVGAQRKAFVESFSKKCLKEFQQTGAAIPCYREYKNNLADIEAHRTFVLGQKAGQVVQCSGTITVMHGGTQKNLNTLLCVLVEGSVVHHINAYNEVLEGRKVGETFSFTGRVYRYQRSDNSIGFGIKPAYLSLDATRNEF